MGVGGFHLVAPGAWTWGSEGGEEGRVEGEEKGLRWGLTSTL